MDNFDENSIINLVNKLEDSDIGEAAYDNLLAIGEATLPFLMIIANEQNQTKDKRLMALNLLGEIGKEQATATLVKATKDEDVLIRKTAANALGWIKFSNQSLDYIIDAFLNDDKVVRSQIAFVLGRIASQGIRSPRAVQLLIDALNDKSQQVQEKAAQALGMFKDADAVEPLINALNGSDMVRNAALSSLGVLQDERAVEPLINLYKNKTSLKTLRQNILINLGLIGSTKAFQLILDTLRDKDVQIRAAAVNALGWLGNQQAIEPLIQALETDEVLVASQAAQSLGQLKAYRVFELLLNKARFAKHPLIQIYSIKGLGELRSEQAFDFLIKVLKSPYSDFRYEAAIALGKLGDERALEELDKLVKNDHSEVNLIQSNITVSQGALEAIKNIEQYQQGDQAKMGEVF